MTNFDDFSVIDRLDTMGAQFTKTDWKIAHYIKETPTSFISLPANEIANILKTSDASIIRFAQKIGYSGLNELKINYKKELKKSSNVTYQNDDEYSQFQTEYFKALQKLFSLINLSDLNLFVSMICTFKSIYVCSFKQHHELANFFSDRFLLAGIKSTPITSLNDFKLHTLSASESELYIVLTINDNESSYSNYCNRLSSTGASVITISDTSQITKKSKSLHLMIPRTTDLFSGYAISSNSLFMILIDILFNHLLSSNIKEYGNNLVKSLEATNSVDENDLRSTKNKIDLLSGDEYAKT